MKIFYINIDSRNDKKIFMESQLKKLKIKAERISALTPAKIDIARIRKKFTSKLSDTEIACTSSHMKIWKKIINSKISYALILEDDVILSENLPNILKCLDEMIKELEFKNIGLLRLETRLEKVYQSSPLIKVNDDYSIVRSFSNQVGAAAYIVSSSFCKKFIGNKKKYEKPIDLFLFYNECIVRNLNINYQLKPALATNHKSHSIKFPFNKSYTSLSSDLEDGRIKKRKNILGKAKRNVVFREIKTIQTQLINLPMRLLSALLGKKTFSKSLVDFK